MGSEKKEGKGLIPVMISGEFSSSSSPGALSNSEKERRASLVEKAISIYSPSGKESEFASFIYEELKRSGFDPRFDSAGNVICETGSRANSLLLLLCGHMDTVAGELPVRREGSLIYGRGATDAKGALMSILFAFEDFASLMEKSNDDDVRGRRRRTLSSSRLAFAAVVNEEGDSSGLNQLIRDSLKADFAIFGEPGGLDKITIGYRGHIPLGITVETQEVHASAPWLAQNSTEILFSIYSRLKSSLDTTALVERKSDGVSIALTRILGGRSHNVTPGRTEASLDVRIPFGMTTSSIKANIVSIVREFEMSFKGSKISLDFGEPTEPYRVDVSSDIVRALNRAMRKSGKLKPSFITKSGTGDMNSYAIAFGAEAITYGPGNTKLSHTTEEVVDIEEVFACSEILESAIHELFHMCENHIDE
jgi:LysW-gamma-L-lysine carboxypeptidase